MTIINSMEQSSFIRQPPTLCASYTKKTGNQLGLKFV